MAGTQVHVKGAPVAEIARPSLRRHARHPGLRAGGVGRVARAEMHRARRSRGTEVSNPAPSSGESGTNSVIGSTQGPVTSSNLIWQRAADWSAKAQSLVRVMKIRLLVFLQHGRHETIDISPVVSSSDCISFS